MSDEPIRDSAIRTQHCYFGRVILVAPVHGAGGQPIAFALMCPELVDIASKGCECQRFTPHKPLWGAATVQGAGQFFAQIMADIELTCAGLKP